MSLSQPVGAAIPAASGSTLPSYPVASNGKRNWAWSAVHPGQEFPSHETVPEIKDGSFADFIDIINPLQHIPIVSTIYRSMTGDTIGGPARILGGLLFGGPVGMAAGIGSTVVAEVTGSDPGSAILASLTGGSDSSSAVASSSGFRYASQAYSRTSSLSSD